jgi:uncharacterized protein YutD
MRDPPRAPFGRAQRGDRLHQRLQEYCFEVHLFRCFYILYRQHWWQQQKQQQQKQQQQKQQQQKQQ